MREVFKSLNRSAGIADVAVDAAAERVARDTSASIVIFPQRGHAKCPPCCFGKFGNENPRQRFLVWFDTFDFPCLAAVGFGFFLVPAADPLRTQQR